MKSRIRSLLPALIYAATGLAHAAATDAPACDTAASTACFFSFQPRSASGALHFYASRDPAPDAAASGAAPTSALIAIHGHSHDADKTFDAALKTVRQAGALDSTLVVAPLFQVAPARAGRCSTAGVPEAREGDLLWTCTSWAEGGAAVNDAALTSFAALDALVARLVARWPSVHTVTVAGFSAGAQMVQHSIGFANVPAGAKVTLRYVVADPGTWLYFDPGRPQPADAGSCPEQNRWKYGTDGLPAALGRSAADARARYAAAEIHYLEGALDDDAARGTAYRVLDRSCGAQAQGPYRLQRGLAYAAYDRTLLAPERQRQVVVVPGCAHDVACVFPSDAARALLVPPR